MHELSIVQAVLEQIEREVHASPHAGVIRRVELSIGRLSGVCADSVRFAFELLSPDTLVASAELHIDQPPAHSVCGDCGRSTEVTDWPMACPECASRNIRIEGGRELLLTSIELDE